MKPEITYYSIINKKDIIVDNKKNRLETEQARTILKKMLNYFNLKMEKIYTTQNGKPFFKDSNIFFNYSHSKNYIACTISNYEVGIDIEETSRNISDDIAKKYLNNEKSNLKRIEIWVKKESYSKLTGLGLQMNFENIELKKIRKKNYFIKNKDYMCSIYCDNDNPKFKNLSIK